MSCRRYYTRQTLACCYMLLHVVTCTADYDSIITVADDTYVLMLSMAVQAHIDCNIWRMAPEPGKETCCQVVKE